MKKFEVVGAGSLVVDADYGSSHVCGNADGVDIGCTWGAHGLAGGVMDVKAVRGLIQYLQDWEYSKKIQNGGEDD